MTVLLTDISICILCGGQGSRMGGVDKGLVPFKGKPLVEHTLGRLPNGVHEIFINANRNHDQYALYGKRVISDSRQNFQGPLAGFESALTAAQSEWVAIVPCDSPLLPMDLIERLAKPPHDIQIRSAHDGEWRQAVFALLHRDMRPAITQYLDRGEAKIDRFYKEVGFVDVDFSDCPAAFANLNSLDDINQL